MLYYPFCSIYYANYYYYGYYIEDAIIADDGIEDGYYNRPYCIYGYIYCGIII